MIFGRCPHSVLLSPMDCPQCLLARGVNATGANPQPDEHDPATMPVAELERIGHDALERALASAPSKHDQLNAAHARLLELEAERDAWRSFADHVVYVTLQDADTYGGAFSTAAAALEDLRRRYPS